MRVSLGVADGGGDGDDGGDDGAAADGGGGGDGDDEPAAAAQMLPMSVGSAEDTGKTPLLRDQIDLLSAI